MLQLIIIFYGPGMWFDNNIWAFGSGRIENVTPMGGDLLLEIVFESAGTKMMMAKTASQYLAKM